MVKDAEKYRDEDEKQKEKIQAKNSLEGFAFNLKQTLDDPALKDKISSEDREKVLQKADETIKWLDNNQTAEKEEYEYKQKELQDVSNPIMTKLYQAGGGVPGAGGMPGGMPNFGGAGDAPGATPSAGGGSSGPTIEEVD